METNKEKPKSYSHVLHREDDYDPKKKSEGFGDTIATITHFFRIDKLANTIAKWMGKEDCGCDRRRKKLNKIIPYKK